MDAPLPADLNSAWEDFFTSDTDSKGSNLYPKIFENGTLFPLQRQNELSLMIEKARSIAPTTVVEIGSDKGGSFYHWIKCLGCVQRAIALEIRGTPFIPLFQKHFPDVEIHGFPKSSYAPETVKEVADIVGFGGIDCLFIDGDKNNFHLDFNSYLPLMRKGGLVFMHDVLDDIPPRKFWYSLRDRFHIEMILDCREGHEMLSKEPKNVYEGWLKHWNVTSCGVGVVYID